jgi:ligand-binding sensor domain-containing protein/serine phosphatase RsbU (regulator of sigma subunit)
MRHLNLFRGREDYNVNVIYQDPKGWIWFGTDRGLFRYDGLNSIMYTISEGLAGNNITSVYSSGDDNLWVGHKNGEISRYDGKTFQPFFPEEGLGKIPVSDIVSDSAGVIWYSTLGEGVFRWDGKYMSNMDVDDGLSDNYVYDIEIDHKGVLWFATDNGITRFSNGKCDVISMKDGLVDNIVKVIKTASDNRLWIGTDEKGVTIYNPADRSFRNMSIWEYGTITGLAISAENEIWISTDKNGIIQLRFLAEGKTSSRKIEVNQKPGSVRINALLKDYEENIWVGGDKQVTQLLPPVFEFLNQSNGTPFEVVNSLAMDNSSSLWVCSEKGLYRGVPTGTGGYRWSNMSEKLNFGKTNFISVYVDSTGSVWTGTYGEGTYRINPSDLNIKHFTTTEGLGDNNIISISGRGNLVWFSTLGGGASCYNINNNQMRNFHDTDLRESYVYATCSDINGKTWIAGSLKYPSYILDNKLYQVNTGNRRIPQLYGVTLDSSGGAWFNTGDKGILHVEGDSVRRYGAEEGIGFDKIESVIFDKLNNLLVIAKKGFIFFKPGTGVILEFGESSALSYLYPALNSVFTDKEDNIWIGTGSGIIKYNPDYLHFIRNNPRIFLSEKKLLNNPVAPGKKVFRYNQNNFTFGYTGIWFSNPEGLKYRYMLKGYEPGWNNYNRNLTRTYSNLQPGKYTFIAEVSLDDKNWFSSADSTFSFRIRPPFWRTWWFITIFIILVASGVYLYIRLRLAKLERDKERLEEEVHKRTEEIRMQNKALAEQKIEIEKQRDLAEEQRDQIEVQKEEIQSSIRYARRIQAAALPPKKLLDSLLKDYFILYKPCDIVSGDFYWVAGSSTHIFFAAGDCTGHGVPGSFMSMLGLSALNDIVKSLKTCKASIILDSLRDRIQASLHQSSDREMVSHDGMDISFCILEKKTNKLQFSGAHNPLYLIRNNELITIPADKIDIGNFSVEKTDFTNNELICEPGDLIYLFTDGYADQFGGPKRKKYKYQKFKDYLLSIHSQNLEQQKISLDNEIESWKGNFEQTDDILVMGIRITREDKEE